MKKKTFITAIISILLFMPATNGFAQENAQPAIEMNTTVKREVTPDEIFLHITIKESDYRGRKTLEEMQQAMIGALMENRIDVPECLSLNYMGSDVSYRIFSSSVRPRSEATYTLKLYDATIMQAVIASLEERQISNIELFRVAYTKESELKSEMAAEAMLQAQAEARTLATAIGQDIGKAINISSWMSGGQATQPRMYRSVANDAAEVTVEEADAAIPQFNIGKLTYSFTVNVKFELK